jgi:hypothetical protein
MTLPFTGIRLVEIMEGREGGTAVCVKAVSRPYIVAHEFYYWIYLDRRVRNLKFRPSLLSGWV